MRSTLCILLSSTLLSCGTGEATDEGARALRAQAWKALVARDYVHMNALLEQAAPLSGGPVGGIRLRYYRGLLARATGDLRGAEALLGGAMREAGRLSLSKEEGMAAEMYAGVLADLGRHEAALGVFETTIPRAAGPRWQVNHGWALLRAMRSGAIEPDWGRVEALFLRALEVSEAPRFRANVLTNLAGVALLRGAQDLASSRLDQASHLDASGRSAEEQTLLRGEIALRRGQPALALAAFAKVRGGDARWRGLHGEARALQLRGQAEPALAKLRAALAALEEASRGAGLSGGRAPFLADRKTLVDEALSALLAAGRVEEAFEVSEAARAQVLRALETPLRLHALDAAAQAEWRRRLGEAQQARARFEAQAQDWELLAGDALQAWSAARNEQSRALAEQFDAAYAWLERRLPESEQGLVPRLQASLGGDEVILAQVLIRSERHLFRVRARAIEHARTDEPLGPWPLSAHVYAIGADLRAAIGTRATHTALPHARLLLRPGGKTAGAALVVADPRLDLPGARREGLSVAGALSGRRLSGDAAHREAVLEALDGASVLHFAGHGVLRDPDPWRAHLALALGTRLSVADLLTARPRVGLVVLSGCETARAHALGERGGESLGLPEAFIAAGAQSVLAADRVLDDTAARGFIERFYRHLGPDGPAEALRAASVESQRQGDDTWTAFRLMGRR